MQKSNMLLLCYTLTAQKSRHIRDRHIRLHMLADVSGHLFLCSSSSFNHSTAAAAAATSIFLFAFQGFIRLSPIRVIIALAIIANVWSNQRSINENTRVNFSK